MLPSIDSPQGDQAERSPATRASAIPLQATAPVSGPLDAVRAQAWVAGTDPSRGQLGLSALCTTEAVPALLELGVFDRICEERANASPARGNSFALDHAGSSNMNEVRGRRNRVLLPRGR